MLTLLLPIVTNTLIARFIYVCITIINLHVYICVYVCARARTTLTATSL